jgi:hypothetical protein
LVDGAPGVKAKREAPPAAATAVKARGEVPVVLAARSEAGEAQPLAQNRRE